MDRSTRPVPAPRLTEVADGVFAYLQPDGGWCLNNAGVVVGDGEVVVVDTAATEPRARRLLRAIRAVTSVTPRTLVNTHHHGDHTFGNFLFATDATIVAHERCRAEMAEAGLGMQELWPAVDWGQVRLALPSLTFRDRMTVHVGRLRLDLVHVGPAHTTNDVAVWVPDRGTLFAGDVAMSGSTPFCLMGSVSGSLRALEQLRALGARTVVCGHGPVAGPEVFDATERYLRWIQRLAAEGRSAGLEPLQVARETDLGEFADLLDAERLVANLHRAYAEAAGAPPGTPLDVPAAFAEMVEYNGGPPACHA